jgi:hypothetical protein
MKTILTALESAESESGGPERFAKTLMGAHGHEFAAGSYDRVQNIPEEFL